MEKELFYQNYLSHLNKQQKEAAQTVEGPVLLLAVPGSGKTTVLVTRLGYMIHCCSITPENILTLTYTVAATKEMRVRFARQFGQEYADKMNFWTINGLSARIIFHYSRYHSKKPAFTLLDNDGAVSRILIDIYRSVTQQYPTEATIKTLRTAITYAKNMMLDEKAIAQMDVSEKEFPAIFKEYQNTLLSQRLMDYDDQMVYAHKILCTVPAVLTYFQDEFQYICVDESQDTSKIQHKIIELLARKNQNIFMVGDEDQSIYGFRAAYPEALISFEKTYPNAKVLLMEENYRSTREIVEIANTFVKRNRFRHDKTVQSTRGNGSQVQILNAENRAAQFSQLAEVARNCTKETAVLYRNNESVIPLIDILDRQGIHFNIRASDAVFFVHRIVSDVSDIIRFSYDQRNAEVFERIYYKLGFPLSKTAMTHACEKSRRSGKTIIEELMLSKEVSQQAQWKLRNLQPNLNRISQAATPAAIVLRTIWENIEYKHFVTKNHFDPTKFEILFIIGKNEKDGKGLLRRLDELADIMRNHKNSDDAKFILSTVHSSKGLEYDRVYLLDVIDQIFPSVTYENTTESRKSETIRLYEEERRLFYVGMTRAKNELYLFDIRETEQAFVDEVRCAIQKEEYLPFRKKAASAPQPFLPNDSHTKSARGFTRNHSPELPADTTGYVAGAAVVHRFFGVGVIKNVNGNKITIVFKKDNQEKTFDLKVVVGQKIIKLQ